MRKLKISIGITLVIFIISFICSFYFPMAISSKIYSNPVKVDKPIAYGANKDEPRIQGESAVTMDLSDNEVIYSKDPNAKRYPASLTKLMTAYLFGTHAKPTDEIPYTQSAEEQPEFSLSKNFWPVKVGETMEAKDVLDGLLLYSANDTAYMIADYVGGNKEGFAKMMNETAQKWGLDGTHFMNPNGLNNPEHYTTAYDIAIIGAHAYSIPWVRETMNTKYAAIHFNQTPNEIIHIENRNANLGKDGNVGGKTGFTFEAGRCLFNVDVRNGKTIVGVIMKSGENEENPEIFKDMDKIMNYSFNATPVVYEKAGSVVAVPTLKYKIFGFFGPSVDIKVPLKLNEDIMYYNNGENNEYSKLEVDTNNISAWDAVNNGVKVNFNELKYNKTYNTTAEITESTLIEISIFPYIALLSFITLIVLSAVFVIKNKKVS